MRPTTEMLLISVIFSIVLEITNLFELGPRALADLLGASVPLDSLRLTLDLDGENELRALKLLFEIFKLSFETFSSVWSLSGVLIFRAAPPANVKLDFPSPRVIYR